MPPLGARAQQAPPGEAPSPESATDESPTEAPEEPVISEGIEAEPLEPVAPGEEIGEILEPEEIAPTEGIEEILVTGTKAGASEVQEVPTSAVGFNPMEIQREQINDIRDLSSYTPNLEIKTAFAASNPVLFIRGVGLDDFNANSGSAVAVYQDGIYMNSPAGQLFQFFDSAGVEVLRGPQGGRYRNATAGAILVRSGQPADEFEAYGTFTYGNYQKKQFEGAIGGPLPNRVGDYVSGRLAFTVHLMDGITKNRCAGQELVDRGQGCYEIPAPDFNLGAPQDIEDPVNDVSMWAGRGMLRFMIPAGGSDVELLLNLHGGRSDGLAAQYQHRGFQVRQGEKQPGRDGSGYRDTDEDPFAGDYNITDDELLDVWGTSLRGSWAPTDLIEITSITGYEFHDRFILENTDANPRNLLAIEYSDTAWQLSQELEVASYWTDSLDTHAGVYFITEDLDAFNIFDTPRSAINFDQDFWQKTYGLAAFGSAEWDFLSDRFTLGGSIRYNWEYKEFGVLSRAFARIGQGIGQVEVKSGTESDVFTGHSGGVSLTYHLTEERDVYVKYSQGWKPGHFNGGAVYSGQIIEPVRPELVDSYEVGLRSSWFDTLLQVDLTAFYYDYQDLQVFQLEQDSRGFPIFQLVNAEEAEVYGVELDLHASPIEGLDLRYHMSFLESEYGKFGQSIFVPGPRPGPGQPREIKEINIDYSGNRLIGSPVWSLGGAVEYAFPVGRFGELIPRFSFSWKDKVFFDPAEGKGAQQDLPDDTIAQDAYWQLHAGLMWRSPEQRFEVTGWVRNLTDEHYKVTSFDVTAPPFQFVLDVYGAPRTYGFTASIYF
jgi:iron complex outermembrane receptor protein